MIKIFKIFLFIISIIFTSCYGVFRTAKPVSEGKWSVGIFWMYYEYKPTSSVTDSPVLIIRRGIEGNKDVGLKLFFSGFEFLGFSNIIDEEKIKFLPSIGWQVGFGIPPFAEIVLILSKKFGLLTPYLSLRGWGLLGDAFLYGLNSGIELEIPKKIYSVKPEEVKSQLYLFIEYYYGKGYRYAFDIERVYNTHIIGGGFCTQF